MQWIFASYLIRDFCFRFLKVVISVMAKVRTMFSCLVFMRAGLGGEEGKIVKKELTQFSGTQWL